MQVQIWNQDAKRSDEAVRKSPRDEVSALVTQGTRGRSLLLVNWTLSEGTKDILRRTLTSQAMLPLRQDDNPGWEAGLANLTEAGWAIGHLQMTTEARMTMHYDRSSLWKEEESG